jgi:hypothetical protein
MHLFAEFLVVAVVSFFVEVLTDQWLIGVSLPVIWAVWRFLRLEGGPPVLAFAFTFHWSQVVIGLYYYVATGRTPIGMTALLYADMVTIGLVCVALFVVGIRLGDAAASRLIEPRPSRAMSISWTNLLIVYFSILAFRTALRDFAWENPQLAQGILALTYIRFALFYLILRRLVTAQRYMLAGGFALIEVALGLTGFFAEFREPLFIAAVVLAEQFEYRRVAHWVALGVVGSAAILIGVLWIGIRSPLREDVDSRARLGVKDRLNFTASLAQTWMSGDKDDKLASVDNFVDRMWDVYYPALALARVPSIVPHTDGEIMMAALQHVLTPRILVPNKADIESDSLQVRRYAGVWVAGPEANTTISFGYPIQGYIDFGIPGLFIPVLIYAIFMGAAYRVFLRIIVHRELAVSVVTVIFWMSLYAFNRSWPKMLGLSLTLMVYLGGFTILLDKYLMSNMQALDELAAERELGSSRP